ncbi:hypothetical protein KKC31_02040, partial [Patescibacteria group bacterium]|nr:hypothetical protein [Patescibacteria group bacterium]
MLRNDETGAPPSSRTTHPALEGVHAFLAEMLTEGYRLKLFDTEMFFALIPPRDLMMALKDSVVVRGNILFTGKFVDERIAYDLSPEASGEIL